MFESESDSQKNAYSDCKYAPKGSAIEAMTRAVICKRFVP